MYELFFVLGLAIFAGFIASIIFDKTRISQVILLIILGFALGPLTHIVDSSPASVIVSLLPFLSTLALIVLLFDAGLMIDVFAVARAIPKSTLFTFLVFALNVLLAASFCVLALGWPLLHGVLLGAALGGTSSAIVIAMVEKARISREMRSLLTVESTITDALCILVAVLAMEIILSNHSLDIAAAFNMLLSSFSSAVLLGAISAALWIFAIDRLQLAKYTYMLTLALVFGLFSITEALKGNGGFAVFVFGMVVGNAKELGRLLRIRKEISINPSIRLFQEEITFFVRTFFFVYIGLLLSPGYFSQYVLLVSCALLLLFLFSRWIVQKIMLGGMQDKDRNIAIAMVPRGLAAAVLASMPLSRGIEIGEFQQIVFVAILFTNIAATLGIFVFERDSKPKKKPKPEEELAEAIEASEGGGNAGKGDAGEAEGASPPRPPAPEG